MPRLPKLTTPRWSVRARVITAVILLAALALVTAGATAYLIERKRVESVEQNSLIQAGELFEQIARDGYNSRTGEPFDSLYDVLYNTLQVVPSDPAQGMIAYVEGQPILHARADVIVRLEDNMEFITQAAVRTMGEVPVITTIRTDQGQFRTAVYPIDFQGTSGAFVIAYDRGLAFSAVNNTYRTYAIVGAVAMLIIGLFSWFLVGRLLAPIRLLRTTSEEISSSDLTRRIPIIGNDDLAVVSETFNKMLDRLEAAFAAQRALLDDVGHELRTPLTIVRGHMELLDPTDVTDVTQTKSLIIDEVDRMNHLVDDLVTLAKARQPDFVRPRAHDVALITDEVLSKASALGDRHWVLDALAEVEWHLDAHRITQALLQLASNSVKFSADGTTVGIGSRVVGGSLHLWVRDQGKGIAPENYDRVFARFGRVDPSVEGSGLGLTIVQSIMTAHDGRVAITSNQDPRDHGTTITLIIPDSANRKDHDEPDSDR